MNGRTAHFIMQTAIAYSATDGGIRFDRAVVNEIEDEQLLNDIILLVADVLRSSNYVHICYRKCMPKLRILLAVVISSLSIIPAYLLVAFLTGDRDNDLWLVSLIVALFISIIGVVFVGLPTHFLLARRGKIRGKNYALVGFIVPSLLTALSHPFGRDGLKAIAIQSVTLGFLGAVVALTFWIVVTFDLDPTQKSNSG